MNVWISDAYLRLAKILIIDQKIEQAKIHSIQKHLEVEKTLEGVFQREGLSI